MRKSRIYPKVASDMFFVQGIWASSFLGVVLVIQIVKMVFSIFNDSDPSSYFVATFISSNIFMLVIGIISAIGFLPHFVSNGVTRKDYFKGTLIGTIGVALAIPVVSAIISSVLDFIINLANLNVRIAPFDGNNAVEEGNLFADIILSIIFTPFIELSSNWLLAIFVFAINIFTYYVAGWLIGSAFVRLKSLGVFSIVLALLLIYVEDLLLSISLGLPIPSFATSVEIPLILSLIGILVSIGIICWVIRQLTKRIIVKF